MFSKPVASYEVIVWKQSPCRGPAKLALRIMKLKRLAVNLKADVSLRSSQYTWIMSKNTPKLYFEENVSNRGEWTWAQCDSRRRSVTFFLTGTLLNNFLLFNSHYSEQFIIPNSLLTRFWGETSQTWFEGFSPCWWRSLEQPGVTERGGRPPPDRAMLFFSFGCEFLTSLLMWKCCGIWVLSSPASQLLKKKFS